MRAKTRLVEAPEGLLYRPGFVGPEEQRALLAAVEALEYSAVSMHGVVARRRVAHFGWRYEFNSYGLVPGPPLPPFVGALRDRAAALAGVAPERFVEALVTHYPAGAGIGWHRDAPRFGAPVVGLSLGSTCRMRLRREGAGETDLFVLELEPGSVYVLAGPARWAWQHHIPACKAQRYSITLRTLRAGAEQGAQPSP